VVPGDMVDDMICVSDPMEVTASAVSSVLSPVNVSPSGPVLVPVNDVVE
jgi:hypothetical protein